MIGQNDQVTRGLVAYYSMRNSGATVFDERGGYNGGASNGVPFSYESGTVGNGARFGVTNTASIDCGRTLFNGASALSMSCWLRWNGKTGNISSIVSKDNQAAQRQFEFVVVNSDNADISTRNHVQSGLYTTNASAYQFTQSTNSPILTGVWHHVAITWEALSNAKIYINGNLSAAKYVNSGTVTALGNGNALFTIGNRSRDFVFYDGGSFPGDIDEVRAYSRAITADEVKQLYRMGATPRRIKE
jgi:hypothetical protein